MNWKSLSCSEDENAAGQESVINKIYYTKQHKFYFLTTSDNYK